MSLTYLKTLSVDVFQIFCFLVREWKQIVIGLPLHWISLITPRNQQLWVFGSWFGLRYSDNSRYLYEYVRAHEKGIRAIWLSHDKGIVARVREEGGEAYLADSFQGFTISCFSGAMFVTASFKDVNAISLSRAFRVHLWHGTPLKKIMHDDIFSRKNARKGESQWKMNRLIHAIFFPFRSHCDRWDLVAAASCEARNRLASAFAISKDDIKVTGYPRADVILASEPTEVDVIQKLKMEFKPKYVVLYAPTHRQEGRTTPNLFSDEDMKRVNSFLSEYNAILLVREHFYHQGDATGETMEENGCRIAYVSEHEEQDVNKILPMTDVLLTDYSSIYYDFLLLNRPIIFTPFDLETYTERDRELYESYGEATPGPKCRNWESVIEEMTFLFDGNDKYQVDRDKVMAKYNHYIDTNNCQRIVDVTKAELMKVRN